MKLIIDIPEDIVVDIKDTYTGDDVLYCAVKYGTPFDSVIEEERKKYNDIALDLLGEVEFYEKAIEDIKAEIDRTAFSTDVVLNIIDKHISRK